MNYRLEMDVGCGRIRGGVDLDHQVAHYFEMKYFTTRPA